MANGTFNGSVSYNYPTEGVIDAKITLAVHVVTLVAGTIANVFVFGELVTKKTRKTDQDVMVINLCFADWSIIMVKFPLKLDTNFRYVHWSVFVCKFVELLPTILHIVGIYTLVLMAVNRCRVLVNPLLASQMKPVIAMLWCLLIWIGSFGLLIPMMIIRYPIGDFTFCHLIPLTAYQIYLFKIYRCVSVAFMFPIPLIIITASYIRLGIHLYKRRVPRVAYVHGNMQMDAGRQENLKIIKTLAITVILFAVFMLPLFVARVLYEVLPLEEQVTKEFYKLTAYTRLVALTHSCVNPIIYGSLTKSFGRKLKTCLCCFRRKSAPNTLSRVTTQSTQTSALGITNVNYEDDERFNAESDNMTSMTGVAGATGIPMDYGDDKDIIAMDDITTQESQ